MHILEKKVNANQKLCVWVEAMCTLGDKKEDSERRSMNSVARGRPQTEEFTASNDGSSSSDAYSTQWLFQPSSTIIAKY